MMDMEKRNIKINIMKKKIIKTYEDAAIFVDALTNTPEPNEAIKQAQIRYKKIKLDRVLLLNRSSEASIGDKLNRFIFNCHHINCVDCIFNKKPGCSSGNLDYDYQSMIDFLNSSKKVFVTRSDIKPFKIK